MTTDRDRRIASLLATAFVDLPTAAYLVPDRAERLKAVSGQFTILADHARSAGGIVSAGEPSAVAGAVVWFDHTTTPDPIPDYERRLREACGPHAHRFMVLDEAMKAHHPTEPHHYLALVGTRPELQGKGIATAMLKQVNEALDQTGTPAYLEAVSEATVRLYERCGFERSGEPFTIGPGGPELHPMWRTPRPPGR